MEIKQYQQRSIDTISTYVSLLEKCSAKLSFYELTDRTYNNDIFPDVPYIGVKIPTGGGKTLVASHATGIIMNHALKHKLGHGIVMWFVPSDAIKTQTLKKLSDKNDWHRQILDEQFDGNVLIFSNENALRIRREDVENNLCIIVSSLDSFRKDKKLQDKYKVYQENGELLSHFEELEDGSELEQDEHGTVVNSLANVIRIDRPLVVIDEGHRTKTKLSIEFLRELLPSFVIEYTATPREGSNILVDVSAADLKEEEMVKIPIQLDTTNDWQETLVRGLEKRQELENDAKRVKGEYIRPIVLIQAQPVSKTKDNITVDRVREELLRKGIPEEEVAIKVSGRDELIGINLLSRKCKVRYIITINALAEGWDCSFAYVLISVANIGARVAVEQIIGRIIRMPYAERKTVPSLNMSYVFTSAKNFTDAASNLIKGLKSHGYNKLDLVQIESDHVRDLREVHRTVKEDLFVPMMALHREKLSFEQLISDRFYLAKQDTDINIGLHYDADGRVLLDIKDDSWVQGAPQQLSFTYRDTRFSREELVLWLDKKLRFTMLDKGDKMAYLEKVVSTLEKSYKISQLSINRFVLAEKLSDKVQSLIEVHTKKQFQKYLKSGDLKTKAFEAFPSSVLLSGETTSLFNKNYYKQVDGLNKEEQQFITRLDLDGLSNIKYWVRNREKKDPFYLQGWKKNKFYPDFVAVTNSGKTLALEWKGADRVSNEDTQYKVEIAKFWEKLGKGKLYFFLVHNGNAEEVLSQLKKL